MPSHLPEYYIGIMSGTSLDGIDTALVEMTGKPALVDFHYTPFSVDLRKSLTTYCQPHHLTLTRTLGQLDSHLGELYATSVNMLLTKAQLSSHNIQAIGCHGQTIHHAPDIPHPFSMQLGNPNIIAELTNITTVADFRRRDIAAGGQGAPLVPYFHDAIFKHPTENRAIVNIGGIANITILPSQQSGKTSSGFDTGPGNTLLDQWILNIKQQPYDHSGFWAQSGQPQPDLIDLLKSDPFFTQAPPKSSGREYFSLTWLTDKLKRLEKNYAPEDIQASLTMLTASTIVDAIETHAPGTERIFICGGGTYNTTLLENIRALQLCPTDSTSILGINPNHVEAIAFAWLAKRCIDKKPGNLTTATGATHPVILGAIYQK
jgi:anhydro-N-acetylmuramic acid kinase